MTSISGGICEIMSDLSDESGFTFPQFQPETRASLRAAVSELGQTHNPIDLTGAVLSNLSLWVDIPRIASSDPEIGLTVINYDLPRSDEILLKGTPAAVAKALTACETPTLLLDSLEIPLNEFGRAYMAEHNIPFAISGLGMGAYVLGRLVWWSERLKQENPLPSLPPGNPSAARPDNEREALEHLANFGVGVVPAVVARNCDEAVAAAHAMEGAVAMKILSPDIAHKSEVGGVKLNVSGDAAVRHAFDSISRSVRSAKPDAAVEGILVSPMRSDGVELFVGIARDPQWGLVAALGLGGIWIEALEDTALILLPTSTAEIIRAFDGLRGAKLLKGYRGSRPVDMDAVADAVVKICDAALALGPELEALEVNPLLADGARIEALDALAVWRAPHPQGR